MIETIKKFFKKIFSFFESEEIEKEKPKTTPQKPRRSRKKPISGKSDIDKQNSK